MKNYFVYAAYFFLASSILSCGKGSQLSESGGTYISSVTTKGSCNVCTPQQNVIDYNYNANHQLISEITLSAQLNDTSLLSYNAQGQLASIYTSNSAAGPLENDVFIYDAQGKIIRRVATPLLPNLSPYDVTFAYDVNNRLIADSVHNGNTADITYYVVLEYDNNENIVRISQYDVSNGISQLSYVQNLIYNQKLNPYYSIKDVHFYETINPLELSKNIAVDTSTSTSSSYTYYSNGLPKELVFKQPSSGYVSTSVYTYKP